MKNKNKGFATVLIVAIIVVIVIGTGVWFVSSNNKSNNDIAQNPSTTTTEPVVTTPTPVTPKPQPTEDPDIIAAKASFDAFNAAGLAKNITLLKTYVVSTDQGQFSSSAQLSGTVPRFISATKEGTNVIITALNYNPTYKKDEKIGFVFVKEGGMWKLSVTLTSERIANTIGSQ